MKTYLLQLEPHDDLVSLQDKLKWARAERILIVWPEQGMLFNRRLDLKRIQRLCVALGAQAALVCRDPEIRYHALRLGMPVFSSTKRAESAPWRLPRRFRQAEKPPPASLPEVQQRRQALQSQRPAKAAPLSWPLRLILFTLGVAAILALAAVLAPGASINLTPVTRWQSTEIEIKAGKQIQTANLSGILPAREIEVVVEGRRSQPTSGTIQIPAQVATGKVIFTNLTDQVVAIPVNTAVRPAENPGLVFLVTRDGEAPAGPGQIVELPVRCQSPGSLGNLPANSLTALEGILGTQVTVTNPNPIQGGSEQTAPAPTAADRRRLATELEKSLAQTAQEEFQSQLEAGDILILESQQRVEILGEAYEPASDQPASQLDLSLRLKFRALKIAAVDIETLARVALSGQALAGFDIDPESLQVTLVSTPEFREDGLFHLTLQARERVSASINANRVVQLALGLPPSLASQRLEQHLALQAAPEITTRPSWWPRLPVLPFRIEVQVAGATP